jgi:NAD+-dependent protein deacetylase sirtuin 6
MSAGYASRLKEYPNKGICGLPEQTETPRMYQKKMQQLIEMLQQSQYTVVLTGAGISTSAGIPDFRGPQGIWTLEQNQKEHRRSQSRAKRQRVGTNSPSPSTNDNNKIEVKQGNRCEMNFTCAKPTLTHRIITELMTKGILQFVVTQNVDGLHRRSGLSRRKHSVLHGCAFTEKCESCCTEYFRDVDVGGMSFQRTGRKCDTCRRGHLRDTLLDWEDPLPEDDLERSEMHCKKADLILCLGTSLRIGPVNQLPLKAKKFVVINLQKTPMDYEASLIIRERVDIVMTDVMKGLGYADFLNASSIDQQKPFPPVERVWKMDPPEKW